MCVTRAPSGWKIPQTHDARVTDKTVRSCWRVNNGFWWFLVRGTCHEDKHNEAPDGSGRLWKGIKKVSKGPGTRLPPSYAVVFSRRVSRVGNLPSEGKKIVYPPVVLRFFQQKSNLELDARHAPCYNILERGANTPERRSS